MTCPKCGQEAIYNNTEVETFRIEEIGSSWPVKILCQRETTYKCTDCSTLITLSETQAYIPS